MMLLLSTTPIIGIWLSQVVVVSHSFVNIPGLCPEMKKKLLRGKMF